NRNAAANRGARDGALARLSLHHHQSFGGGRLAQVSPYHGRGTLPEQPDGSGLTMKKKKQNVVLGVTGSIAAYKAAELASLLVKQGHDVFVVMTKDATEFITPLTLQTLSKNPVTTGFYDEKQSWHPGHIALADRADLLVIAPATAHIIAELAHGL